MKSRQERARIIDADRLFLSSQVVLASYDECLSHRTHFANRSIEPQCCVDIMCKQIAGDPTPCHIDVQPPKGFPALREICRDCPVLKKYGAVVEDPPKLASVDQVLGKDNSRSATVVVPDHVGHLGFFDGPNHGLRFADSSSEWLLTQHHLARFCSRKYDFGVRVVRRGDIDDIDFRGIDDGPPIRFKPFVAPVGSKGPGAFGIPGADLLQYGTVRELEKLRGLRKCVRMSSPHKAAAD